MYARAVRRGRAGLQRPFKRRYGQFRKSADLTAVPLVHDEDGSTWINWPHCADVQHVTRTVGPLFEDGQLTLNGTQAALDAALVRLPLIACEPNSGELVKLFDQELDDGGHYCLCRRIDADLPDGAQRLASWLLGSMVNCALAGDRTILIQAFT